MSCYSGPEISNNGLVFHYDMNNTQKSWKGKPTTNLVTNPNDITGINLGGSSPTYNAIDLPQEIISKSNETDKADLVEKGTGSGWIAWTRTVVSNNTQYMVSWYFKKYSSETIITWNWGGAHQGNKSTFNISLLSGTISALNIISGESYFIYDAGNGWWRIGCSTTMTTGTGCYPQINFSYGIYVVGFQIEQGIIGSPFVIGTRTTTQAILDLTKNNTITIDNLSYNSNNTFAFNGNSDYMHPPINWSYLNSSALDVWFYSTSHGSGFKTIFGYRHNSGYSNPTIGSLYLSNSNLSASVITANQVYRIVTTTTNIQTNTWYNAVLNKDTLTGNLEIYLNGILNGSITFDASSYAQWNTLGQYIGENILDIGKSTNTNAGQGWGVDYFSGYIPIAKVYNRVLSASEIKQNFEATRGRYGI